MMRGLRLMKARRRLKGKVVSIAYITYFNVHINRFMSFQGVGDTEYDQNSG